MILWTLLPCEAWSYLSQNYAAQTRILTVIIFTSQICPILSDTWSHQWHLNPQQTLLSCRVVTATHISTFLMVPWSVYFAHRHTCSSHTDWQLLHQTVDTCTHSRVWVYVKVCELVWPCLTLKMEVLTERPSSISRALDLHHPPGNSARRPQSRWVGHAQVTWLPLDLSNNQYSI